MIMGIVKNIMSLFFDDSGVFDIANSKLYKKEIFRS